MGRVPFVKMHGLGNDFVVIDDRALAARGLDLSIIDAEFARKTCDRRFGIGADQLLRVREAFRPAGPGGGAAGAAGAAGADARMEILNADGTVAEMCGNGIRAVALYLRLRWKELAARERLKIETLAGVLEIEVRGDDEFRVNMGVPHLGAGFQGGAGESLEVAGRPLLFFEVSMGNPHAVFFDEDAERLPRLGPEIEKHPRFPKRTNVEFVSPRDGVLNVRVWERGAGLTLACGTGACASAVAALALGRVSGGKREVTVRLPGGDLRIAWEGAGHPVFMEGPATLVFEGEFSLGA